MAVPPADDLVLSMPPDPGLARVARLVTLHFLTQNGVRVLEARRCARTVQERSKVALSKASRGGDEVPVDLVMTSATGVVEAVLRRGPDGETTPLIRIDSETGS